jgi:hypothetical protein
MLDILDILNIIYNISKIFYLSFYIMNDSSNVSKLNPKKIKITNNSNKKPNKIPNKKSSKSTYTYNNLFGVNNIKINRTIRDISIIIASFYGMLYSSQLNSLYTCHENLFLKAHISIRYLISFGIFYFVCLIVTQDLNSYPPIQQLLNCFIYFIIFIILNRLDYMLTLIVLGLMAIVYFIFLNKNYYYKLNPNSNVISIYNSTGTNSVGTGPNTTSNVPNTTSNVPNTASNVPNTLNKKVIKTEVENGTLSTHSAAFIADHQYWITWDVPFRIRLFKVEANQYYLLSYLNKIIIFLIIILVIFGFISYIGVLKYTSQNKIKLYNVLISNRECSSYYYGLTFFEYFLLAFNYNYYIKKFKPMNQTKNIHL